MLVLHRVTTVALNRYKNISVTHTMYTVHNASNQQTNKGHKYHMSERTHYQLPKASLFCSEFQSIDTQIVCFSGSILSSINGIRSHAQADCHRNRSLLTRLQRVVTPGKGSETGHFPVLWVQLGLCPRENLLGLLTKTKLPGQRESCQRRKSWSHQKKIKECLDLCKQN